MVYKESSVYKNGLNVKDVENAAATWLNITNKMGSPHTSYFSNSGFLFEYNKTLSLLHIAFFVNNLTPVSLNVGEYINLWDFDVNLPGTNDNRLFNGEGIAIAARTNQSSSVCLISPRPYVLAGRSNMIYATVYSNMSADIITGFNQMYAINKDLKNEFDQFLE